MHLDEMNRSHYPTKLAVRSLSVALLLTTLSISVAFAQDGEGDSPPPPQEEGARGEEDDDRETQRPDTDDDKPSSTDEEQEEPAEQESTGEKVERIYRSLQEDQANQAKEDATPQQQPLTPEEKFEQTFQVKRRLSAVARAKEVERTRDTARPTFLVPVEQAEPPQLEWGAYTECFHTDNYETILHAQCDHEQKRCLMAETRVLRERTPGEEASAAQLSTRSAARQDYCAQSYPLSALDLLIEQGYTLTPALLAAPYGYKRDDRGRVFQRFFDLRSRAVLGVGYAGLMNDATPYTSSLRVETRSSYEHLSLHDARRHRFRFLEGSLMLDPMRIDATLFNYERGRVGRDPIFYITELIGEPTRYDIYANIGYGITFLRYDYRNLGRALEKSPTDNPTLAMPTTQHFIDIAHAYLQWELLQDLSVEDFFALRVGGGLGTRGRGNETLYVYPEVGFMASWLKSPRGLFELSTRGKMRYIVEPSTDTAILAADVTASAEWVFLTISDQPISLYLEPRIDWLGYRGGEAPLQELRVMSGVRFSLFTPAPKNPEIYGAELEQ